MKSKIRSEMTNAPVSIASDVTINDAQEIMRTWGMRHLPVLEGDKLIGIVSDRDILRAGVLQKPGSTEVREIMSQSPYCIQQNASVAEVARVMAERKLGCAIVIDFMDRVLGIFTTTDALNLLATILNTPNEADYRVIQLREYLDRRRQAKKVSAG